MFAIGQDVVCIDDDWRFAPGLPANRTQPLPRKKCIYRVTGASAAYGVLFIELEEFPPYRLPTGRLRRRQFDSNCFRPVKRTDISVFTALLKPAPARCQESLDA